METREKELQRLCKAVLTAGIRDTGDHGKGSECPFCRISCSWKEAGESGSLLNIEHYADCPVLIAKDLMDKAT